ncbi:Vitamin B12 import ATP-binding protein BtuD [Paenibacillus allorhizoplanae]|uniref:Vitamin B12 import ATP-binding protein BtuD n=1 Tax=Paenibacillus allorhizoplanae TaxID=2905648 RepID=A0ABN8G1Q3_9BACL|nr:ABC transporter ATP-binding protein [Paenibacillus allorhizoplanae]CAH1193157.1 Vitamin B12 import ATP-binding protein BtuD [Paenibacillus allorhizoplanae]
MSVAIHVHNVVKKYDSGKITIIPGLSVDIKNGEFFTLLGPSGCGKTTLLRMIAGFSSVEDGEIRFDDQVINEIPAYKRNIGMVFQNYAIFPHLTVKQNVEYGLKLRKLPKADVHKRTEEIMGVVQIDPYKERLPEKLSGGQQQRVALARAIVIRPNVLLMDEPLSNLDAKLRVDMRTAIRDIQKDVGITTVYVTHDQEEALAISDRIAVMKEGTIQQVGNPREIYTRPANTFVSSFIGHSNFFKGIIRFKGNEKRVVFQNGYSISMNNLVDDVTDGQNVIIAVRPEQFSIADTGLKATISKSTFLGQYINYEVTFQEEMTMDAGMSCEFVQDLGHANQFYDLHNQLYLAPKSEKINVFTEDGERSLIKGVKKYD